MKSFKINLALLLLNFTHLVQRCVAYMMGAKAPALDCDTAQIRVLDCSGLARYLIAKATGGMWTIPDGSANQHDYFEARAQAGQIHKLAQYSDVQPAVSGDKDRLFICFMAPGAEYPGSSGHVWFVFRGYTIESHGGGRTPERPHGIGCHSRPWDTAVLLNNCCAAYEVPLT